MSRETKTFSLPGSTSANTTVNVGTQLVSCVGVEKTRRCRFKIDPELLRRREDRKSGFGEGKQGKRINTRSNQYAK